MKVRPEQMQQLGQAAQACSVFPERQVICEAICTCNVAYDLSVAGAKLKQVCVSAALKALDEAAGNKTTIKAEINFDMTKKLPDPIMSRKNPLVGTEYLPRRTDAIPGFKPNTGMVRRPDIIVVNDPTKPPTQDNIRYVVEVKFPPDFMGDEQRLAYERIAGGKDKVVLLGPRECGCPEEEKEREPVPEEVPVPVPEEETEPEPAFSLPKPGTLELVLLALVLLAFVADDLIPAGVTQANDALIPGILARIAMAF